MATFFFAFANFVFGSIPWLNVLKNAFQLKLVGLPMGLVAEYERLRNIATRPLLDFLRAFGIALSPSLIDVAVVYVLLALAVVRSHTLTRKRDRREFARDPEVFRQNLRKAAVTAGVDPIDLRDRVEYGLKVGFLPWIYTQYRAWRGGLRWPVVIFRNFRQVVGGSEKGGDVARGPLIHISLAIVSAAAGCAFYLLLSHVSSR